MIHLGVYLPSAQMNSRNLLGMDCIRLQLALSLVLVSLSSPPLIDHQRLNTFLPGVLLFSPDPFFLSVILRTLNTMLRGQPTVICMIICITNIWLLPNFRRKWHFKNSDCHSYLRDYKHLFVNITLWVGCK